MNNNWENVPYAKGKNIELYYAGSSLDTKKLLDFCQKIENMFFRDFKIENQKLDTPIKFYLTTNRAGWLAFDEKYPDKVSSYCLDKQADYDWFTFKTMQELIRNFIMRDYISKNLSSNEIANAIGDYYGNIINYGNEYNTKFKYWFIKNILNETIHKDSESEDDRNRTLVVSYLIENNMQDKLLCENANEIVSKLFDTAKNYYINKYQTDKLPKCVDDIKNADELISFVCKNVATGYKGVDNQIYVNSYQNLHSNLKIQSVEESLSNGVGTCIEQGMILEKVLKSKGLQTKLFMVANYNELNTLDSFKDLSTHIIVLYKDKDKWVNVESANIMYHGATTYNTLNEALTETTSRYFFNSHFEVYELPFIPVGATMVDLYNHATKQKKINFTGERITDFQIDYTQAENTK